MNKQLRAALAFLCAPLAVVAFVALVLAVVINFPQLAG